MSVSLSPTFDVADVRLASPLRRLGLVRADANCSALVEQLLHIAQAGLPRMFRPGVRQFAFTRKRTRAGRVEAVGESFRYGAISVLGARYLGKSAQRPIFNGETAAEYCGRMLGELGRVENIGDAALLTWAAAEVKHPDLPGALGRLSKMSAVETDCDTVAAAWVLSAFLAARDRADVEAEIGAAHGRLMRAFNAEAGVFAHRTSRESSNGARAHVACFADQVYPIQALARHHALFGDPGSLAAADACAKLICDAQGAHGQWWWHYDSRTGRVIEGYPVYSVHQHAMAPMALLDLAEAGGVCHADAIRKGLAWLSERPEVKRLLIDEDHMVIWRKVGRTDPRKLVRSMRAAATRADPKRRLRLLDVVFPARRVDYECRPYELGWLLYAWLHTL